MIIKSLKQCSVPGRGMPTPSLTNRSTFLLEISTKLDKTKYTNNLDGVRYKYDVAAYMRKGWLWGLANNYY